MATATTVKERPQNLTRVDTPAGRDLTGGGPAGNSPAEVTAWAEALRDSFEAKGKLLTVRGIVRAARSAGAVEAIPVIKEIYADEYGDEVGADGGTPPERKPTPAKAEKPAPAAPAKAANGKPPAKAAKSAPVKAAAAPGKKGAKPAPAKTNPAKKGSGKKTAAAPAKAAKKAAPGKPERNGGRVPELTGEVVKVNNKTDVEVIVRRSEKATKIMVFGKYPVRAILRHMGAEGWGKPEAESALKRMGVLPVMGEAAGAVINNQLASGKSGEDGWAGPVPELTASEARAIKALRNAD